MQPDIPESLEVKQTEPSMQSQRPETDKKMPKQFCLAVSVFRSESSQKHCLFDQDKFHVEYKQDTLHDTVYVFRECKSGKDIEILLVPEEKVKYGDLPSEHCELLFTIRKKLTDEEQNPEDCFVIEPESLSYMESLEELSKFDKTIYKSITKLSFAEKQKNQVRVQKDQTLRFGMHKYKVVEVEKESLRERQASEKDSQGSKLKPEDQVAQGQVSQQNTCKICLCEDSCSESPEDDTLITPCRCKGSCEYVHLKCLQMWLDSSLSKEKKWLVSSYTWGKYQCELCKVHFPLKIKVRNRQIYLPSFNLPESPYLVLERVFPAQRKKIFIFSTEENKYKSQITVGRSSHSDMAIRDNSVSRKHSAFVFDRKSRQFYLRDEGSTHGTLVMVQKPEVIKSGSSYQVGNVMISFQVNRWSSGYNPNSSSHAMLFGAEEDVGEEVWEW